MKIDQVPENTEVTVRQIRKSDNPFLKKVEAMGLKKGEKIKVLSKVGRNIVISVEGRKMVIDEDLAKEIEVE